MREVRVDIVGQTDANGNASIRVPLDNTGEFQNLKFSAGLPTGSAEWAITASGTTLTFGRGRRVTLGPELIKPQDVSATVVAITNGPVNALVLGSASGQAGTEREMLLVHQPVPNTITLETFASQLLLASITTPGNGILQTKTVPVPPNLAAIGYLVTGSLPQTTRVVAVGITTSHVWFDVNPSLVGQFNIYKFTDKSDSQVQFQVQDNGSAPITAFLIGFSYTALTVVEQEQGTTFQVLQNPGPGEWKADAGTPGAGANATASQAGTAGKSLICRWLHAELVASGAANAVTRWSLTDGTFTLNGTMGVQAAGSSQQLALAGMQIKAAVGAALTLTISGLANAFATCSMGGDLE